jgi:hypothetical protein
MLQVSYFYQYLLQFQRLPMGDLGEIVLKKKAATLRMLDKQIEPPAYHLEFVHSTPNMVDFITWLSARLSISYQDVEMSINIYIQYLKQVLDKDGKLHWNQMGDWVINDSGQIVFRGSFEMIAGYDTLSAEKLIRENAGHQVLIGDRTYSGEQLQHLLQQNKKKPLKNITIIVAAAITIAAFFVILFSFITKPGFKYHHQYQMKIDPKGPQETYKLISAD